MLTVLDEDIPAVLEKLGQKQAVLDGKILCHECKTLIDLTNIQMIIPVENESFYYICDNAECMDAYLIKQKEV